MSVATRRLVLITGTGRSGTSTMAGTFHHLGLAVPGVLFEVNETNPKGFFEAKWPAAFHTTLCERAKIHVMDSRPGSFADLQAVIRPKDRARLAGWIAKVADGHDQVVVKDPRSVWTQALWAEAAAENGFETAYVSMLRHPAEVIGSRSTYYVAEGDPGRERYEIFNVARWIHNQLLSERETRGRTRGFVRYQDLLSDWRPVLARLQDQVGVTYDSDPTSGTPSPVDDFITPELRRVQVTWDDLAIPVSLRDLAEEVWQALNVLHDAETPEAHATLDDLERRYDALFEMASAISHDAAEARVARAKSAWAASQREIELEGGDRPVRDVSGRELLKIVFSRGVKRLPVKG